MVTTPSAHAGSPSLPEGTLLAGRYVLGRMIGEGGMGEVYLATHHKIDKQVALKLLAPEQARRPRTVSRFLQEAKAASKIRHPNIVDITDFGEDQGRAFFAMEYLEGEDLSFLLKREGRISWERTRAIMVQLLEGLGAAHDAGILHRDVKPHNCFISPREHSPEFVKIIDFGIAKIRDGSEEQLTRTGAIMGTAEYMSPEQGQGAELDGRSDLYSVGVILYRMLVGRVPFKAGNPMATVFQHVHDAPVPPSKACPEAKFGGMVDALLAKALAKEPDDRFASPAEFIAAMQAIEDPGAAAPREGTRVRPWPIVAGLVLVLLAVGGWIASRSWAPSTPPAETTAAFEEAKASRSSAPDPPPNVDPAGPADTPERVDVAAAALSADERPASEASVPADADADPRSEPTPPLERSEAAEADADDPPAPRPSVPLRRSQRQVQNVLQKLRGKVTACGKKSGLFPGEKVSVTASIGTGGKPTKVSVSGAHAAEGVACITKALKRAKFGPAQRVQTVEHRFTI